MVLLRLRRQQAQPARQARELVLVVEAVPVTRHDVGGAHHVARGQRLVQGFLDEAVLFEPAARPLMQGGSLGRAAAFAQASGEEVLEEVVKAKELVRSIERDDEEIGVVQIG